MGESTLKIEIALPEELQKLTAMADSFHREDGHPLAESGPSALAALVAGSPHGDAYFVKMDGHPIGYFVLCYTMSIEFGGLVVILDDLFLEKDYRSRGIGTRVLEEVERMARGKGAVQIFLEVELGNRRAAELYRKSGFRLRERAMMEKNF